MHAGSARGIDLLVQARHRFEMFEMDWEGLTRRGLGPRGGTYCVSRVAAIEASVGPVLGVPSNFVGGS